MADDDTTQLLHRWNNGDTAALDALIPQVYADLRRIARSELRGFHGQHTLQPTALVNDVFVKLLGRDVAVQLSDRGHFFTLAARMMRQMLIDRARRRSSDKHGGQWHRDDFTQALDVPAPEADRLPELDEALQELARIQPRLAEVVELRYFLGLTVAEVAALRQMDERSVYRDWAMARAWLRERLESGRACQPSAPDCVAFGRSLRNSCHDFRRSRMRPAGPARTAAGRGAGHPPARTGAAGHR